MKNEKLSPKNVTIVNMTTQDHIKVSGGDPHSEPLDPKFKKIILPYWIQFCMAQDNPWKEVNKNDAKFVKQFWPCVFSKPLQYNITKQSQVWKKVCP